MELNWLARSLVLLSLAPLADAQLRLVREETSIPSGVPSGSWSNGSVFQSACRVADLDGDGIDEIAFGLPRAGDGGPNRGAVQIVFVNHDGSVRRSVQISQTSGGFTGFLDDGDGFGSSVAPLGDLNGDGIGDLAVGATGDDDGGNNLGAVWILFLKADGSVLTHWKISATSGGFGGPLPALAGVGAVLASREPSGVGDATVLCVGEFASELRLLTLAHNGSVSSARTLAYPRQARGLAFLPDLDGDGRAELAAVGLEFVASEPDVSLDVLHLAADGALVSVQMLANLYPQFPSLEITAGPFIPSNYVGVGGLASADLDRDGVPELLLCGPASNGADVLWILFMNDDLTLREVRALAPGHEGVVAGLPFFARSVAVVGDVDGDGLDDIVCGSLRSGTTSPSLELCFLEFPGSIRSQNGSGANQEILAPAHTGVLGGPLDLDLNCIGHAPAIALLVGHARPARFSVPGGEVLVDLSSPRIVRAALPHAGLVRRFHFDLPNDPALSGLEVFLQGTCLGAPGRRFSNALDLRLGH